MLKIILRVYVTMLPTVLTGIVHAIYCKSAMLSRLKGPIDGGKILKDGKRLFGPNKTWRGFIGTPVISVITHVLWGGICSFCNVLESLCCYYLHYDNTLAYNVLIGFLIGFIYAVSELPNSYIKRRIDISSGKQGTGWKGLLFKVYDQIDSLIGVDVLVVVVGKLSVAYYFAFLVLGGLTHLGLNFVLYEMKLRKNIL